MGAPALKSRLIEIERDQEFPFSHLLTKVLVESLCPLLQSEIIFGSLKPVNEKEKVSYWIDASIRGDLEGQMGLAAELGTLRNISSHLGTQDRLGKPDTRGALIVIHEALVLALEKQFGQEDFRCGLEKGTGYLEGHELTPESAPWFSCSVETRWGPLAVYLALTPTHPELVSEISSLQNTIEPRKIRVFASQMEALFTSLKNLENLEAHLLQGPHVRSQMRGQIKKMKRMFQQLKSEPLETLFTPARKMVAELGKQQGKQIRLQTFGTWLYLDKTLLNFLYEPILHLVRNAVDHGVEEPRERERVGKAAHATIKISAGFNQGVLRLLLMDDGKGLDYGSIRERAVSKGILTADEANSRMKEDLAQLIFEPGFSTRIQADAVSGRGLGLDIVKRCIESVEGSIRLVSTSPKGTSFEVLIPLNEDFAPKSFTHAAPLPTSPEEGEKSQLLDELWGYFDRLAKSLRAMEEERTVHSAYEAYRLAHSIKGVCGFLGWQRVAGFCHHYEDLLKLLSEGKSPIDDMALNLILDAGAHLKEFCEAARTHGTYSLYRIRRSESRVLQLIWSATRNDEKTHLFLGKYHLNSVENYLLPLAKQGSFSVRPEADFSKAIGLPYGALIQFNGDRRGFAGIFLPEKTFSEVIYPMVSGSKEPGNPKRQLGFLTEFANLMGNQFAEACAQAGITLQPSAPLTYYGWGQPLRILGNPTYCYACEINGHAFYLAGDFRLPQEASESLPPQETAFAPQVLIEEAKRQSENLFGQYGLKIFFNETHTQSDLIGFDGGISAIVSCVSEDAGVPDSVIFMSYDASLAQHLFQSFTANMGTPSLGMMDPYDCLTENSNIIGGLLISELEKKGIKLKLSLPSLFVGKAYVANFNRLFVTNKIVGTTEKGRFELQVLVTELAE